MRHLKFTALLGLLATAGSAAQGVIPRSHTLLATPRLLSGRLRVAGKPGDFALRSPHSTAIVRKSDGWVVDFWPAKRTRATAPQLRGATNVDGLWRWHPVVLQHRNITSVTGERVRALQGAVEVSASVAIGPTQIDVTTVYRLDADAPQIQATTRFRHRSGPVVPHLQLGDAMKWGNVDYIIDGHRYTPYRYDGPARWIGRHGAGGDLILRTQMKDPMHVKLNARHRGLAPTIIATYATVTLKPGAETSVRRSLSYAPIQRVPRQEPPQGVIKAEVVDAKGRPLAAKLSFRGVHGTRDPDFGNDGDERGAGRFAWSGNGRFLRSLPVGRYTVMATAGIERDAAHWEVSVEPDTITEIRGKVPRVIPTPGWLSADLHLHQLPSVDADIACSTRVISIAAEGVEVAAATDHYAITDLGPAKRHLQKTGALASELITLVGSEVSTVGYRFGHFNVFPVSPDADIPYEDTNPRELFATMRKVSPEGIIQINHPRWSDIGYFQHFRLDPRSGRLPRRVENRYVSAFDAIEVFNGIDAESEPKIRLVLSDWMHLLGQGHRYTATGNSDSHKLFFVDPGMPRNLIRYGSASDDETDLRASTDSIIRAIRNGHVVVTNGPVIDVSIAGKGPGEVVQAPRGSVLQLALKIRAAPWIDVTEAQILLGAKKHQVRIIPVPKVTDPTRVDTSIPIKFHGNTFIVVVARGRTPLPNVYMEQARPFAFTNPIWIEHVPDGKGPH